MPRNEANVDERIVEMRIDNRQFVDGAEKTISILDKLKKALEFKDADKGLNDLQKTADRMDLSSVATNLDRISERFTTMGLIGQNVIGRLTNSVAGFVENTVKGLTIDPVTGGFDKYESILRSTKTILAATLNEEVPSRFGTQLEYVDSMLEQAAFYSDETSASLSDMVSTASKLTNVGIGLEESVVDAMGISNWGWLSGATVQEQGRAMYNLAQAMSTGSVKLIDWKSIENANMGTIEFKNTVLETAVALGTLGKDADGAYKTLDKYGKITKDSEEVTAKNFNSMLSTGFFTSNVLSRTLQIYGEYSRRLGRVMSDTGFSDAGIEAKDVAETVDEIAEKVASGTITLEEGLEAWREDLAKSFQPDKLPGIESLRYAFELLSGDEEALAARAAELGQEYHALSEEEFNLAKRAHEAGSEYQTFADVIDATKDAVSTGWMKTFKLIFGDAEEAKALWTDVGGVFYDIFAAGASRRNAILKWWKTPGEGVESGRDSFLQAVTNLYEGISGIVDPIKEAWNDIFSWGSAEAAGKKLRDLTKAFENFTERLKLSESASRGIKNFFSVIFGWAKKVLSVFKPIISFIGNAFIAIRDVVNLFFESFDNEEGKFDSSHFMEGLPGIFSSISSTVKNALHGVKEFFNQFSSIPIVNSIINFVLTSVDFISTKLGDLIGMLRDGNDTLEDTETPVGKIREWFEKIWDYVSNITFNLDTLKDGLGKVSEIVQTIYSGITGDEGDFKERIKAMLRAALDAVKETLSEVKIEDIFEGARLGIMGYVALQFADFVSSFKKAAKDFKTIPESITGVFNSLSDTIKSYGKSQSANAMVKMAAAILMVAGAIWVLSKIPEEKFAAIAVTLAFFFIVLSKIVKNISSIKSFTDNKNNLIVNVLPKFAASLVAVAILLAVAVAAFVKLKDLTGPQIGKALLAILGIFFLVSLLMLAVKVIFEDGDPKGLSALIGIAVVLYAVISSLAKVKDLSIEQIFVTLGMMVLVVLAIAAVMAAVKNVTASGGVGALLVLLGLVAVLIAITPMILAFAAMGWEGVLPAIVMIAVVAAAIAGIMLVVSTIGASGGAVKGAAALAIVGAAFILFAIALAITGPAILAFGASIVALMDILATTEDIGGKLKLLKMFGKALIVASVAAVAFGIALLIGGVGFSLFGAGMLAVAAAVVTLTAVLVPFGSVLTEFCNMIKDNGWALVGAISTIILAIVTAILISKMNIAYSVVAVILAIITVIVQNGPQILSALAQILEQILLFIYQLVPMLIKFLVMTMLLIINGTADSLRANKAALISAIENLASVILEVAVEVISRLVGDVVGFFVEAVGEALDAVGLKGVVESIFDVSFDGRTISNKVYSYGEALSDSIYRSFGGKEREAARYGEEAILSFAEEVDSKKSVVEGSLTDTLTTPMTNAMTNMAALADQDLSISPTITPTVDMTNVENSAVKAQDLFTGGSLDFRTNRMLSGGALGNIGQNVQNVTENKNTYSNDSYTVNVYPSAEVDEEGVANLVVDKIIRLGAGAR